MFILTYCSKKAAIETAIGVANDVPDLCFVPLGVWLLLLLGSHSLKGQEDSTASPTVARLSASANAVGLKGDRFPFASVEWIQITFSSRAGYARSRFAPLLEAAANRRV